MRKTFLGGINPNKNPGGASRLTFSKGGPADAHKGRDHTNLTQLKSLEAVKRANFKGCYGDGYKQKLYETFANLQKEGILEFITDPNILLSKDYNTWSTRIREDGSMINKSSEELAKAHGIFAIKQRGELVAAIGVWDVSYKPLIGESINLLQRGSLIVNPKLRGIELGSYLIERINLLFQAYAIYSITLVKSVSQSNKDIGNDVFTVLDLQKNYHGFFNRLEKNRGNFNYQHDGDDYLGHYILMNTTMQQILRQDKGYVEVMTATQKNLIPTLDAQSK